jgi:5-methylcytosine-specific restriction enzyme A
MNRWKRLKAQRLKAEPNCRTCGRLANEVDHIHNLAAGGQPYDYHNTQSLCTDCHKTKTQHEANTARTTPRRY